MATDLACYLLLIEAWESRGNEWIKHILSTKRLVCRFPRLQLFLTGSEKIYKRPISSKKIITWQFLLGKHISCHSSSTKHGAWINWLQQVYTWNAYVIIDSNIIYRTCFKCRPMWERSRTALVFDWNGNHIFSFGKSVIVWSNFSIILLITNAVICKRVFF